MNNLSQLQVPSCNSCRNAEPLGFSISMAFQPIVNVITQQVFAQEALVRGTNQEPASTIFEQVNNDNLYKFDQTCRVTAIDFASRLNIDSYVSINFMPNAIYQSESCIRTTIVAAKKYQFPINKIMFEITESEKIKNTGKLKEIVDHYKSLGFVTAIDDFGAGFSGLNLLADIQTDFIKLDLALVRNIHLDKNRLAIVKGIMTFCNDLNIRVIAEGIECYEELEVLKDEGIELFQGYYFAKPAFEAIASIPPEVFLSRTAA